MAKKWDGSKVIKEIDAALDRAQAQFVTNTRSKLSAASPVLTGRLASSWNIGRNQPDLSAPPVREAPGPNPVKAIQRADHLRRQLVYQQQPALHASGPLMTRTTAAGVVVIGSPELRTTSARMLTASFSGN